MLGEVDEFSRWLEGEELHPAYAAEYVEKIDARRRLLERVGAVGAPDATKSRSPEGWAQLVDVEASVQAGHMVLPYENLARQVLESSQGMVVGVQTLEEALVLWAFSEEEREYIGLEDGMDMETLDNSQSQRLLEALLRRLGLLGEWEVVVEENTTSMKTNKRTKQIIMPGDWEYSARKAYNPGHELVHAVRAENGGKQECQLLSRGMSGYLDTEEGVATVAEMVLGEPFGHERQQLFAARYLAVAMAMKVKPDGEDEWQARHTMQEIYDTVVDYGLDEEEAATLVWRIFRGTSLRQEVVEVDVALNDETVVSLPIAEVYAKDSVYFRGMIQVLDWIQKTMPVYEGVRSDLTTEAQSFDARLLARVGWALHMLKSEDNGIKSWSDLRRHYQRLVDVGRAGLLDLVNVLSAGKFTLEVLDEESPWLDLIDFKLSGRFVDFSKILRPADQIGT